MLGFELPRIYKVFNDFVYSKLYRYQSCLHLLHLRLAKVYMYTMIHGSVVTNMSNVTNLIFLHVKCYVHAIKV